MRFPRPYEQLQVVDFSVILNRFKTQLTDVFVRTLKKINRGLDLTTRSVVTGSEGGREGIGEN